MMKAVIHLDRSGAAAFIGWAGEVNTFAELPLATENVGSFYMVLNATGSRFLLNYKASGLYRSEGGSWIKKNNVGLYLNDDQFAVYNAVDNSKMISFDVSSIATGTRRTATWQDSDGTVAWLTDLLKQKSGIALASSFSGNTKKTAAILFSTPFPSANYSIVVTAHTQNNTTFSIDYEARTATGFVINAHVNNINNLIDVTWIASQIGEN